MLMEVIWKEFQATKKRFISIATKEWLMQLQLAAISSYSLLGRFCSGIFYIANFGDFRVVSIRVVRATCEVLAI